MIVIKKLLFIIIVKPFESNLLRFKITFGNRAIFTCFKKVVTIVTT